MKIVIDIPIHIYYAIQHTKQIEKKESVPAFYNELLTAVEKAEIFQKGEYINMNERRFEVLLDENTLAANMRLEDALLFINAVFDKYYKDLFTLSIREMTIKNELNKEEVNNLLDDLIKKDVDHPLGEDKNV